MTSNLEYTNAALDRRLDDTRRDVEEAIRLIEDVETVLDGIGTRLSAGKALDDPRHGSSETHAWTVLQQLALSKAILGSLHGCVEVEVEFIRAGGMGAVDE